MVKLVNWRHLNEYARIFGLAKMHGLWCEFVKQGTFSWKEIETEDLEGRRLIFHSWNPAAKSLVWTSSPPFAPRLKSIF